MDDTSLNSTQLETKPIDTKEGVLYEADPIALEIPDEDLVRILDKRHKDDSNFFDKKKNLTERRRRNKTYLFGQQIIEKEEKHELKDYESRYQDNILYEIEASIKPLALSRLPDFIVLPGNETDEQKETADSLTEIVNSDMRKRENRRVLSLGFKHLPVYFTGIIKVLWDPQLDDYRYENVNPEYVVVDHTAKSNDADRMDTITQTLPITVQDVIMRFPKKKDEFIAQLKLDGVVVGEEVTWKHLATEIKIKEVWFTWYVKKDTEWERIEGVLWKYKKVILDKIKNPNFDYEGETRYFSYLDPSLESTKTTVDPQIMALHQLVGLPTPPVQQEQVYHNYFDQPRKPFFFMGYDQWGESPYDETSRIEQNIRNQESLDKRGKQIEETLAQRGKHIYSTDTGLSGSEIERIDPRNPDQDILIQGNVNNTHQYIAPERPTESEFQEKDGVRSRMFSLAGATNLNGQLQSSVATSNQIAREANYTRIDDLTEETINAASEWMASWALQFIKLRYTEPHMKRILGDKGSVVFQKLHRDMIADGMEVMIKASGTDKLKAQQNAMDMAKLGAPFTDPLNMFKDMQMSDPEGRAEMGAMFGSDPQGYIAKYILKQDSTQQMADTMQAGDQAAGGTQAPPVAPVAQLAPPAQAPQPAPQNPTPQNTAQVPAQPPTTPPAASPRNL